MPGNRTFSICAFFLLQRGPPQKVGVQHVYGGVQGHSGKRFNLERFSTIPNFSEKFPWSTKYWEIEHFYLAHFSCCSGVHHKKSECSTSTVVSKVTVGNVLIWSAFLPFLIFPRNSPEAQNIGKSNIFIWRIFPAAAGSTTKSLSAARLRWCPRSQWETFWFGALFYPS